MSRISSIFDLLAKITLDKSEYERGLNEAEKSGSRIGSKIGAGFAKVGKAVAVGIGAASTAVGTLATMSVKGYSDYEQLAGGVETLFKKSSQSVIKNASKAYETAGMSANEYMETVTGFSAALIQSTGRGAQTDLEALKKNLKNKYDEVKKHWQKRIKLTKDSSAKESLRTQMEAELKSLKLKNAKVLAQAKAANETSVTTEKSLARAAKLADQAIIDMSDNVNKMGYFQKEQPMLNRLNCWETLRAA